MSSQNTGHVFEELLLASVGLLALVSHVYAQESAPLHPIEIDESVSAYLDPRVVAIAKDPRLLTRLDDEEFLEAYPHALASNVNCIARCLPQAWLGRRAACPLPFSVRRGGPSGPFVEMRPEDTFAVRPSDTFSMCPNDNRMFFWARSDHEQIVGWANLDQSDRFGPDDKLILCLVPTSSSENWYIQFPNDVKTATAAEKWAVGILGPALDLKLHDFEDVTIRDHVLTFSALGEKRPDDEHKVQIVAAQGVIQVQLDVYSEGEKTAPQKQPPMQAYIPKRDRGLPPGWPPTGKESKEE